MDKMIDQDLL